MSTIYHHKRTDIDFLVAEDFSLNWLVRKFCGKSAIKAYAALRVTGHDAPSSFISAFGLQFYGHPDAIAKAAEAFEMTGAYQDAAEEMTKYLGTERIKKELRDRCAETSNFTQSYAMALRIELHHVLFGGDSFEEVHRTNQRDDAAYAEFEKVRRVDMRAAEHRDSHVLGNAAPLSHQPSGHNYQERVYAA